MYKPLQELAREYSPDLTAEEIGEKTHEIELEVCRITFASRQCEVRSKLTWSVQNFERRNLGQNFSDVFYAISDIFRNISDDNGIQSSLFMIQISSFTVAAYQFICKRWNYMNLFKDLKPTVWAEWLTQFPSSDWS